MKKTMRQQVFTEEDFYRIISKGIPPPDQVLSDLSDFVAILYDAFDYSFSRTAEFVKLYPNNIETRKWFIPQLLRFLVHNYLSQKGIKAQLVDENDEVISADESEKTNWKQQVLAGNGIAGIIRGYEYRILKALNGEPPPPGSDPKLDFYRQTHLKFYQPHLIPTEGENKPKALKPHIIFLWEIDANKFIRLYLTIPKYADKFKVYEHYTIPISHPATTIKPESEDTAELEIKDYSEQ